MRVIINGEPHELDEEAGLADVLAILGYESGRGLAVAVDGEVIPKARWDNLGLAGGMKVEVLRAVQGG